MSDPAIEIHTKRLKHIRDRTRELIEGGLDEAVAKTQAILEADKEWPIDDGVLNREFAEQHYRKGQAPRPAYPIVRGINWAADRERWEVICRIGNTRHWVGRFAPREYVNAVEALNQKQIHLRGEERAKSYLIDIAKIRIGVEQADQEAAKTITTA